MICNAGLVTNHCPGASSYWSQPCWTSPSLSSRVPSALFFSASLNMFLEYVDHLVLAPPRPEDGHGNNAGLVTDHCPLQPATSTSGTGAVFKCVPKGNGKAQVRELRRVCCCIEFSSIIKSGVDRVARYRETALANASLCRHPPFGPSLLLQKLCPTASFTESSAPLSSTPLRRCALPGVGYLP